MRCLWGSDLELSLLCSLGWGCVGSLDFAGVA